MQLGRQTHRTSELPWQLIGKSLSIVGCSPTASDEQSSSSDHGNLRIALQNHPDTEENCSHPYC